MSSLTLEELVEMLGLDFGVEIETIKEQGPEGLRGHELVQELLRHPQGGVEVTLQAIKLVFAHLSGEGEDLWILPDEEIRGNLREMQEAVVAQEHAAVAAEVELEAQVASERDLVDRSWVTEGVARDGARRTPIELRTFKLVSTGLGEPSLYRLFDPVAGGKPSSETPTPCEGGFQTADGSGWKAGETSPDTDPEAIDAWEQALEAWKETASDPTDISAPDRPTRPLGADVGTLLARKEQENA